ncbi:MAG: hypothetical protein IKY91_03110 [Akkermansia sp.]|nr:hypothetical protein [Akkermansia sp.]
MVDNDDKYASDEESLTQVRSIIKQLNEDKPATEKNREVVVRADGTKVVRVTKKRRVMMTAADHRRRSRRQIAFALVGVVILAALAVGVLFFRMAGMTGNAYVAACQAELQQRWGASAVQLEGAGVEGTSLHLTSVVAEFPESSMLQRVELSGVEAKLDMMSFFTKVLEGEELEVDRVLIQLRPGAVMQMPAQNGADMWRFARVSCKDFSVRFGDTGQDGPMELRNAQAYMYYPQKNRVNSVVMLRGGKLAIRNWKTVSISGGKARLSATGITDFTISGSTDVATDTVEQRRTTIAFAGRIEDAAGFDGPYSVESDNMSLADFTNGRFAEFLTARTVAVSHGKISDKATIQLVGSGEAVPAFRGEWHLKDISLSSFPALMAITEHIEPGKRRFYNPLSLHRGYVVLGAQDGSVSVSLPEGAVLERDLVNLQGKIELNSSNELSGTLDYGVPVALTRVEYPDGLPDPVFQASGEWAWLRTHVKGLGNMPGDDMAEVEARAQVARADRPARIPFDQIDINRLSEQLGSGQSGVQSTFAPEPVAAPQGGDDTKSPASDSSNPFEENNPFEEKKEDPFSNPFPF